MKNKSNLVRIAGLALVLFILVFTGIASCLEKQSRYHDLVEAGHYEVYFTYIARDSEYRLFLMLHEPPADADLLKERAAAILDETMIADLHSRSEYLEFGAHPIAVYIMRPNSELPYGWEKSELNISMNFDQSAFYRAAALRVEIPADAQKAEDCTYHLYEH